MIYKPQVNEYSRLVEVWESAVKATHDFLSEEDFDFYKSQLKPVYFPQVSLYCFKNQDNMILGFIGVDDKRIEMLFVHNDYRGKGIGKQLLNYAITNFHVNEVDVNEQNEGAVGFYKSFGFVMNSRSELDSSGNHYPIINMIIR